MKCFGKFLFFWFDADTNRYCFWSSSFTSSLHHLRRTAKALLIECFERSLFSWFDAYECCFGPSLAGLDDLKRTAKRVFVNVLEGICFLG